jgi:dephospho-CoA kinase
VYLVGLTGGIGSGKSTVAERLAARGVPLVDADVVAREVVEPGEPALAELAERFGPGVLTADGELDRPALAELAFADDVERAALDAIMHPRISERITERLQQLAAAGEPLVVLDHPLLLEIGGHDHVNAVVVVIAPEEVRVRRLVEQRGLPEHDVRARIRAQTDDETRRAAADHVVVNDGDLEGLLERTDELLACLRDASGAGEPRAGRER